MEEVKRDIRAVLRLFHSGLDLGSLQFQYARLTGCKILREQLEFLLADCGDFVKIITSKGGCKWRLQETVSLPFCQSAAPIKLVSKEKKKLRRSNSFSSISNCRGLINRRSNVNDQSADHYDRGRPLQRDKKVVQRGRSASRTNSSEKPSGLSRSNAPLRDNKSAQPEASVDKPSDTRNPAGINRSGPEVQPLKTASDYSNLPQFLQEPMTSDQFLVCLNDWLDSAPELPDSGSYEASVSQLNQKHSTIGLLQRVQDGTTSVRLTPCSPEDISTALVAKNSLVSSERLTRVTFAEDLVDVREISKLESPLESDCESPEKKSPPEPVEWHLEKIAIKELPKLIFPPMENKWPIRVTQFDSPDRFFFQLIGPDYYHSYTRMQEDLQLFYLNNFAILPKVTHSDMSCMYACRIEDVYSRAAITEVLAGDHLVRVKLIDLGDCQIVPRSDLRLLHKKYSKLSPQCISARLHNVDFTNNKLAITVQSVVEFLHLQVDNRNLFVRVMEIDSDGSLLAELIDESDPCEPVSINAALSELLADQMDKCQQQLSSEMSHLVIEDTSTQLQSGEIAGLSPTSTISTVDDGYFGSMASRSGLSGVIIPPYQNLSVRSQMDVMITSIEDPTCFYVQPADFTSKFLAEIEAQMCDFYKDTTGGNEVDLCASAPFCAVNLHFLDIGYNKWLRGFLMSQSHHRAEVLLVDSGEVVNVTVGDLRPIDSRFTWLPMQAIKCSLHGISSTNLSFANLTKQFEEVLDVGHTCRVEIVTTQIEDLSSTSPGLPVASVVLFKLEELSGPSVNQLLM